jgi:hypothetical protein
MLTEEKLNSSGAGRVFSKLNGSAGTVNGCLLHQYSMQQYCCIFIPEDNCIYKMYETGREARYIHGMHAGEIDITFIFFSSDA